MKNKMKVFLISMFTTLAIIAGIATFAKADVGVTDCYVAKTADYPGYAVNFGTFTARWDTVGTKNGNREDVTRIENGNRINAKYFLLIITPDTDALDKFIKGQVKAKKLMRTTQGRKREKSGRKSGNLKMRGYPADFFMKDVMYDNAMKKNAEHYDKVRKKK